MTTSILPAGFLPSGAKLVLSQHEEQQVRQALNTLTPRRVRRALAAYAEERKFVDGKKAAPFLTHVGAHLEKRGLSSMQVQLINVTAAQTWTWFRTFLNHWIISTERSTPAAVDARD